MILFLKLKNIGFQFFVLQEESFCGHARSTIAVFKVLNRSEFVLSDAIVNLNCINYLSGDFYERISLIFSTSKVCNQRFSS